VAAVSRLWLVTHHVSGHLLSGDTPPQSKYINFILVDTKGRLLSCFKLMLFIIIGCISSEGSILASGSADCTVKLWDVNTSTKVSRTEEK